MTGYIVRRLLLVFPTLLGIVTINFLVVQLAPGGPVERLLAQIVGEVDDVEARLGAGADALVPDAERSYRGAQGLRPELVSEIERMFGFDRPLHERYLETVWRLLRFDFGNSLFRDRPVLDLIMERLPVSISLGLWSTLLIYLIAVPLGIASAVRRGTHFDAWSSIVVLTCHAIPGFLFAVLLLVFFAGGRFLSLFPLRGLVSDGWAAMPWPERIADYAWHMALPTLAVTIGGFAALALITRNAFLDEIGKVYVLAARARGASRNRVLWRHVFRNAMLVVLSGLPAAVIGILFAGGIMVEVIFSLEGLGLLGFEAALNRDYPIMFATLYVLTLIGLLVNLASDLIYVLVDPRIDFAARRA